MEINKVNRKISYKKHIISFFITLTIFIIVFSAFNFLNNKRFAYLKTSKKDIQQEINSFNFAKVEFCKKIEKSTLSITFRNFTNKREVMERILGKEDEEVIDLKNKITLIQIEYLNLIEKANKKCEFQIIPIIYFYSNKDNQDNHQKQKIILLYLNNKYSNLRIFSFDSALNLPEVTNLKSKISINKENNDIIIKIKNKKYYGFQSLEDLEKILENFNLKLKLESKI